MKKENLFWLSSVFFSNKIPYAPLLPQNSKGKIRTPGSKDFKSLLRTNDFLLSDFIEKCIMWDPDCRTKPEEVIIIFKA